MATLRFFGELVVGDGGVGLLVAAGLLVGVGLLIGVGLLVGLGLLVGVGLLVGGELRCSPRQRLTVDSGIPCLRAAAQVPRVSASASAWSRCCCVYLRLRGGGVACFCIEWLRRARLPPGRKCPEFLGLARRKMFGNRR